LQRRLAGRTRLADFLLEHGRNSNSLHIIALMLNRTFPALICMHVTTRMPPRSKQDARPHNCDRTPHARSARIVTQARSICGDIRRRMT
jgi:hypothetical protein